MKDELFFAIRRDGSLDVEVTSRGWNFGQVSARHRRMLKARPKGESGREYMGTLPPGLDEAAFNAAVLAAVALMDFQVDGREAGDYRFVHEAQSVVH